MGWARTSSTVHFKICWTSLFSCTSSGGSIAESRVTTEGVSTRSVFTGEGLGRTLPSPTCYLGDCYCCYAEGLGRRAGCAYCAGGNLRSGNSGYRCTSARIRFRSKDFFSAFPKPLKYALPLAIRLNTAVGTMTLMPTALVFKQAESCTVPLLIRK